MKKVASPILKHFSKRDQRLLVWMGVMFSLFLVKSWADSYDLGVKLYEQGNYSAASQALRAALDEQGQSEQGQNPNIRYYLADTYVKLNRLAEAQAEYQTIMALAPDSQAARLSQVALSHLQSYLQEPASKRWSSWVGFTQGTQAASQGVQDTQADHYKGPVQDGNDYLNDILNNGQVVRWSLVAMPLKFYIEQSPAGIRNFQPAFVSQVRQAMDAWVNVLGHQLSYVLVNSPEQADIRVSWTNTIDTNGKTEDGGTAYTAGLTQPRIREGQLLNMDVRIATFDVHGNPQPTSMIYPVSIHELGHALGLLGHSSNPNDIMSAENQSVTTPSVRDSNTIRRLYSLTADINNLPAVSHPNNSRRQSDLASKLDESIAKMEAQVRQDDMALSWLNLGILYFQKAKQLESQGTAAAAVDQDPKTWYQKALSATNQAIQREPKDPRAYHKRSLIDQALNNYNQALQDIQTAISFNRQEPEYYMLEAWYFAKLGQKAQARSALDTYLLYQPGEAQSPDVKSILDELSQK